MGGGQFPTTSDNRLRYEARRRGLMRAVRLYNYNSRHRRVIGTPVGTGDHDMARDEHQCWYTGWSLQGTAASGCRHLGLAEDQCWIIVLGGALEYPQRDTSHCVKSSQTELVWVDNTRSSSLGTSQCHLHEIATDLVATSAFVVAEDGRRSDSID